MLDDRRFSRPNPSRANCCLNNSRSSSLNAQDNPIFCPRRNANNIFSSICIFPAVPNIGSWNTRPIYLARLYSAMCVTSTSLMCNVPSSTENTPAIEFNNVLLPAPLPPITVTKSPSSNCKSMPRRAIFSFTVPLWKAFTIPFNVNMCIPPY